MANKIPLKPLLLLVFSFLVITASAATNTIAPNPEYASIAKRFAKFLPREHLSRNKIDDDISQMTWTNYIASLDYERIYFLDSDIKKFKAKELLLDDQIKAGDLSFAYEVFDTFKQRIADRYKYVDSFLKDELKLDANETYVWQRKDLPWPKDLEESNNIWRKKISNEYIQQILSRELSKSTTNQPSATSTNAPAPPITAPLSPEKTILKRYEIMMTMMNDNDAEWILQKYLSAFCHAYDPHSSYMSPSSMADFNIEMKLSLVGIGALLRAEDGAAKIVKTIAGGPADMDKRPIRLVPGDKIIAVGQGDEEPVNILHLPLYKIVKLIRGEKETRVVLVVIPSSDPTGSTTKIVDLIRGEVKLEEQAAQWKTMNIKGKNEAQKKFGIISLPAFYANMHVMSPDDPEYRSSAHDVNKIISAAATQNIDGIILDLRNNGGGSLMECIMMTGLFIKDGPVVQVRERYWTRPLFDENSATAYSGPLVILVNLNSASASEILAGALQDYGRALIIGDSKTHGKGTVQTILPLDRFRSSLGSVRVTTASYYRINGGSTQLKGIVPDIVLHSPWEYLGLDEKTLPNAMKWSMVPAAKYNQSNFLKQVIPELTQKSTKRLADDDRYKAYTNLIDRIRQRVENRELSLNLEKRRGLAKTESELAELQNQLSPMDDDDDTDSHKDLVLMESLQILSDLTDIQSKQPVTNKKKPIEKKQTFFDSIINWMLNV